MYRMANQADSAADQRGHLATAHSHLGDLEAAKFALVRHGSYLPERTPSRDSIVSPTCGNVISSEAR